MLPRTVAVGLLAAATCCCFLATAGVVAQQQPVQGGAGETDVNSVAITTVSSALNESDSVVSVSVGLQNGGVGVDSSQNGGVSVDSSQNGGGRRVAPSLTGIGSVCGRDADCPAQLACLAGSCQDPCTALACPLEGGHCKGSRRSHWAAHIKHILFFFLFFFLFTSLH
jgi:hypothetical protein